VIQDQDASSPELSPAGETAAAGSGKAVLRLRVFPVKPGSWVSKLFGLLGPDPIRALCGRQPSTVLRQPLLWVFMMLMASNKKIMGKLTLPKYLRILA
jgi:Mn2+/Fe2+ NRAMP family transporter